MGSPLAVLAQPPPNVKPTCDPYFRQKPEATIEERLIFAHAGRRGMTTVAESPDILLVDDGELDGVADVLAAQGIGFERLKGNQIPSDVAPPRDLLIVTPRRVERVRRGSPPEALPGRPLRIIAVAEDSPAMRRRLRRNGLHLLIRLPANPDIWRLLVARATYRGNERRRDRRVAVGSPVSLDTGVQSTVLLDLSNRGCRLQTSEPIAVGDAVEFAIPEDGGAWAEHGPLTLRGSVRRLAREAEDDRSMVAVVFDPEMADRTRTQLTALINHWASGPHSLESASLSGAPPIPPCQLPTLPDLMLDDETDPPVVASSEVEVQLEPEAGETRNRREHTRGHYASSVVAEAAQGPLVLIGRDLSARGMRVEHHPDLRIGDRFQIALHGPNPGQPIVVDAEIVRDDGPTGFGVLFDRLGTQEGTELEKMVACLPVVEALDENEDTGVGAILSEVLAD